MKPGFGQRGVGSYKRYHRKRHYYDGGGYLSTAIFSIPGSIFFSILVVSIAWAASSCGQTEPDDITRMDVDGVECVVARDPYEGKTRGLDCEWPGEPSTTVSTRP